MAKVLVRNTCEHPIIVSTPTSGADQTTTAVVFPYAKQKPEDRAILVPSETLVEESWLEEARKNVTVNSYFKEGMLQLVKAESPAKK